MDDRTYRVVTFREGNTLIAQCLENDICAFAEDEETLRDRFLQTFCAEWVYTVGRYGRPLGSIEPAPARFHELWEESEIREQLSTVPAPIMMAQAA